MPAPEEAALIVLRERLVKTADRRRLMVETSHDSPSRGSNTNRPKIG